MPKRTTPFQRMIAMLSAALGPGAKVTESAMLVDRANGEEREVDVLIEGTVGGYPMTVGVEVNEKNKPASSTWVELQRGRYQDLPVDRLVLVSRKGFYKKALVKAAFHRIEALSIQEALDTDWNAWAQRESTGIFSLVNINYNCTARVVQPDGSEDVIPAPLAAQMRIGSTSLAVGSMVDQLLKLTPVRDAFDQVMKGKDEGDYTFEYTDPTGIFRINEDGTETPILAIYIAMHVTMRRTPVDLTSGRFRGSPFVAGKGQGSSHSLEFTLASAPDGSTRGFLLDGSCLRSLQSDHKPKPTEGPS